MTFEKEQYSPESKFDFLPEGSWVDLQTTCTECKGHSSWEPNFDKIYIRLLGHACSNGSTGIPAEMHKEQRAQQSRDESWQNVHPIDGSCVLKLS